MSKNNKNKNNLPVSFYETQEYIIEEVFDKDEGVEFAVFIKAQEKVKYTKEIQLENGQTLVPIKEQNLIKDKVILFPSYTSVYFTEQELVLQIRKFIHKYLDIPEIYEVIATHYILMSWVFERLSVVPYLRALGDFGVGKTRFIQTIGALCYKSMFLAGATSDAYLFRVIELFGGTLVINEFERVNTDLQSQITIILNNGYEKGMPVGRVEGDKRELKTFNVFCPKIFSTRKKFDDQALESRIITIPLQDTTRSDIPTFLDELFWIEAESIRNKLLLYRFKHLNDLIWQEKDNERKTKLLSGIQPRLKQTLLPLLYVVSELEVEEQFVAFAHDYQKNLVDARSYETPGIVFQKSIELFVQEKGKVTVKQITESVNKDIEKEQYHLTSKKIGKILREDLGLKTEKSTGGRYYVIFNEERLQYLATRYGLENPLNPLTPLSDSNRKVDLEELVDV